MSANMESNIYAPPKAVMTDQVPADNRNALYVVSLKKFWLLGVLTLGFYGVYWYYRNWSLIREKDNDNVIPLLRAIFSVFFVHSLFRRIDARLTAAGKDFYWPFEGLATLVVISMVLNGILTRITDEGQAGAVLNLISIGLTVVIIYMKTYAQRAINVAADDEHGNSNADFTALNYVWMVLGAIIWMLVLLGIWAMWTGYTG